MTVDPPMPMVIMNDMELVIVDDKKVYKFYNLLDDVDVFEKNLHLFKRRFRV